MHVLPRVRELEQRFPDVLTVIGVHAGKYTAERTTARIRRAVARLRVEHPVVNDRQVRIWRSYAVEAWPTIAIVAPDGHLLTVRAGEFSTDEVAGILEMAVAAYDREGALVRGQGPALRPEPLLPAPPGPLLYPSRLASAGSRLYVSDTGHDQVVELRLLEGRGCPASGPVAIAERTWGCGDPGFADGTLRHSCFDRPTGLAVHGETLYVADRGNHAIRAIALGDGSVTTVAGTGTIGGWPLRPGRGTSAALRSPWGLAVAGDSLVIAMAGSHQLWRLALDGGWGLTVAAGTGGEAIVDGPAAGALLAQPTGVTATGGGELYFTDCESSSVRRLSGGTGGEVRTLVGTGLFDWGDTDGAGDAAELQHAEDLALHDGLLVVADTYNDKLKAVDPSTRACRTLPGDAGSGEHLASPAGVCSTGERLWVVDTDAHRIALVDPAAGGLRTLEID